METLLELQLMDEYDAEIGEIIISLPILNSRNKHFKITISIN